MKKLIALDALFCSGDLQAQQNLFNIPSGDITRKGNYFISINLTSTCGMNSKVNLPRWWALGKGWDGQSKSG